MKLAMKLPGLIAWTSIALLAILHESGAQNSSTSSEPNVGSYILQGLTPDTTSVSNGSSSTISHSNVSTTSTTFTSVPTASVESNVPTSSTTLHALLNSSTISANLKTVKANVTASNGTVTGSLTETITSWSTSLFKDSDMIKAKSCWSNYSSWWMTYASPCVYTKDSCDAVTTSGLYTYTTVTSLYPWRNASTYKLCDGYPRADFPATTTTLTSIYTTSEGNFLQQNGEPMPLHCEPDISGPECAIFYFGSNLHSLSNETLDTRILYAACGDAIDGGLPCLIQGGPARLIYFPVTTTNGGFCAGNGSTVTETDASSVVSALGTEFTSGTAYVSFETLYAAFRPSQADKAGALQIGPTFSNAIFSFQSDEISTNCYTRGFAEGGAFGTGTMLNYADLNSPISASAYQCQNQCYSVSTSVCYNSSIGGASITIGTSVSWSVLYGCSYSSIYYPDDFCSTIWDNFNPLLAVPTRLQQLAPEWSTCSFWHDRQPNIVFDPPTALHEVDAAATPTLPNAAPTTAASPSPTAAPVAGPTSTTAKDASTTIGGTVASSRQGDPTIAPASAQDESQDSAQSTQATAGHPASFIIGHLSDLDTASNLPDATTLFTNDPDLVVVQPTSQDFTVSLTPASGQEATADQPVAVSDPAGNSGPVAASNAASVADVDLGSTTVRATVLSGSTLVVDGSQAPIDQSITVGNVELSVASEGLAVHVAAAAATPTSDANVAIISNGNSDYITASFEGDGATISIGGSATTINGVGLTLASGGIIAAGHTYVPSVSTASITAVISLPSNGGILTATFNADSHVATIGGQTVTLGGASATVNGYVVSLASAGLVIGDRTYAPAPARTTVMDPQVTTFTIGSGAVTATLLSDGQLAAIDGSTISLGASAVTVDGVAASLGSQGLVVSPAEGLSTTLGVGDELVTAVFYSGEAVAVVDGTRLTVGGPRVTIDGMVLSVASDGLKSVPTSSSSSHHTTRSATAIQSSSSTHAATSTSSAPKLFAISSVALAFAALMLSMVL